MPKTLKESKDNSKKNKVLTSKVEKTHKYKPINERKVKIPDNEIEEMRRTATMSSDQLYDELNTDPEKPVDMLRVLALQMASGVMVRNLESTGGIMTFSDPPPMGPPPEWYEEDGQMKLRKRENKAE